MPGPERSVRIGMDPDGTVRLIGKVTSARRLLKQVGALITSDAKRAFQEQSFAGVPWPEKYPGQSDPFVSIAGVVQDFSEGRKAPMKETLERKPALFRTGELSRSISFDVTSDTSVEIGAAVPYASLHQTGGWSNQPVTDDVKDRLNTWLGVSKKKRIFAPDYISVEEFTSWAKAKGYGFKKKKRSKSGMESVDFNPNAVYRPKLAFLLRSNVTELETQVNRRPFIGITEQRADQITELLMAHLTGG